MNFNNLDLNLLVVFDSVFDEGSITKASDKLNLSQSAVSNALNRLRYTMTVSYTHLTLPTNREV